MTEPRFTLLAAGLLASCFLAPEALAAQVESVEVVMEPRDASVVLGDTLDVTVTVSNPTDEAIPNLVVHLDITDPEISTSVDPEDWTSTLSIPIDTVGPGASTVANWTIQPISGGTFSVYAVVLTAGADSTSVSNVATVDVIDRRNLNPGGILGAALGVPGFIGLLLVARLRYSRAGSKRHAVG